MVNLRWVLGCALLGCCSAHAANMDVEWYQPFHFSPPMANYSRVVLFGRSSAGVTVSIDKNLVVTENPAVMDTFAELQKSDVLQTTADSGRYFQLSLTLPQGLVQIPINFIKDERTVTYVISLQVGKDKLSISVPTIKDDRTIEESRLKLKKFVQKKYGLGLPYAQVLEGLWLSAGLGASFQIISQTLGSDTNLKFKSIDAPSANVRATWNKTRWLANFNYLYQPGKVSKVSSPFTLRNSSYVWSTFNVEGGYNWRNEYFGERSRFTWLLGIQQHQIPSFRVNFGNEIQNQSLNVTNLSFGPMFALELDKNYMLEVFMHYQHNISASTYGGGSFSADPKLSFDGSVGVMRKIGKKNFIGAFWFGQWHRYDISFVNTVDQQQTTGTESLFYSSLDLRWVHRF